LKLSPVLLAAIGAAAPMYWYAIITIHNGSNASEFGTIFEGAMSEHTLWGRTTAALGLIFANGRSHKLLSALTILLGLAAWRHRIMRWPLIIIAIPFTVIWATKFSYDGRNLALAMPFWAICAAAGLSSIIIGDRVETANLAFTRWVEDFLPRLVVPLAAFVVALGWARFIQNDQAGMLKRQAKIEMEHMGSGGVCNTRYLSFLHAVSPDIVLSEWRWACAFRSNEIKAVCRRIDPAHFDVEQASVQTMGKVALVILFQNKSNNRLSSDLKKAGFKREAILPCDYESALFVRQVKR
jgi:hypothetical protein